MSKGPLMIGRLPSNTTWLATIIIIVANHVVFEGKRPIIKGPFDINFFPAGPVSVLDSDLTEITKRLGPRVENVSMGSKAYAPAFSLIRAFVSAEPQVI